MGTETVFCKLTVLFEDPFWVGLYERNQGGRLEVCKITFGGEPRDGEVLAWLLDHWRELRFSPAVEEPRRDAPKNPKRARREARKAQDAAAGIGTKAQQAIQLQRERSKAERAALARDRREEERQRRYLLRQQRRKEKHRTG